MLVFDRYPLVDGTFFLSPKQHAKGCIEVSPAENLLRWMHLRAYSQRPTNQPTNIIFERWGRSMTDLLIRLHQTLALPA